MIADEEQRLVRAAASGDAGAFERLVTENQGHVYNLAYKLTGSEQDALDVSQDVFLRAYQNLRSFRGDSRMSVWLYRLTYNASMDLIKRSRRGTVVQMPADDEGAELELPDLAPLPDEELERREELEAVRDALSELDEDKRRILLMREYRDMSYADIARALGIEEGTVKSRLARARLALAENLKKRGTFSVPDQSNKQNTKPEGGERRGRT